MPIDRRHFFQIAGAGASWIGLGAGAAETIPGLEAVPTDPNAA